MKKLIVILALGVIGYSAGAAGVEALVNMLSSNVHHHQHQAEEIWSKN